ncbi:MAG TPA: NAD(P)/FAD-dependent oxidoreductase, partial [Bacteroidota bacterium]|nr:NAD(P)/FAD-dependent oxidoreductase [Bacteroidota bacterium]
YSECERLGVWYRRCGKLIVAVNQDEVPELEKIYERGKVNGVPDTEFLDAPQAKKIEPNITCVSAIFVPSTGVVDSHELMKAYMHESRSNGGDIAFGVEFLDAAPTSSGYTLSLKDKGGERTDLSSRFVINAAGLFSDVVASKFGIDVQAAGYKIYPNRGHYYRVSATRSKLVTRLVYPMPPPKLTGLGVHITVDRAGQVKLGPDFEYIDPSTPVSEWYKFDDSRKEKFYTAVARYFPALQREDLSPDQVGVRPKIQAPGEPVKDFIIQEESVRGLPGLVNLIGIESPGLTCSHEIAKQVAGTLASMK